MISHGRHDAQPRERGAAGGGGQPLPQHAAGAARRCSSSRPARQVQSAAFERITRATSASTRWRRRASTSRTSCSPHELVRVLTEREIANQEKATFEKQQRAETSRIEMEKAKGTADMQSQLASAQVGRADQDQRGARPARPRRGARPPTCSSPVRPRPRRTQAIGLAEAKATEALGARPGHRVRGAEGGTRRAGDRGGGGGQRGGRRPHHRGPRGARHRRGRLARRPRGHPHALAHPGRPALRR